MNSPENLQWGTYNVICLPCCHACEMHNMLRRLNSIIAALKPQSNGPSHSKQQPRAVLAVPNVTAHPSTASVATSYDSMQHNNCLWSLKNYLGLTRWLVCSFVCRLARGTDATTGVAEVSSLARNSRKIYACGVHKRITLVFACFIVHCSSEIVASSSLYMYLSTLIFFDMRV